MTIRQKAAAQIASITLTQDALALDRDYALRLAAKAKTPEQKEYRETQAKTITLRLMDLTDELDAATLILSEEPPDPV
jgi:HKD family nuclease